MNPTLRALNRFGLGGRPGEPARVGDPRSWLEAQLGGGAPLIEGPARDQRRALAEALAAEAGTAGRATGVRERIRDQLTEIRALEIRGALTARVLSKRPFVERLVAFWSNHLCVSSTTTPAALVADYERDAIRPHVLGRFEDMVLASAHHPAMLFYLDNAASIGPGSPAALARRGRERGLNENYARELLELHTLGVNGGYTEDDVLEVARTLTGWTVGSADGRSPPGNESTQVVMSGVVFRFVSDRHEPGARTVLGRRYAQPGVEQGEAVIRDLCAHPSTARFVATKLVRHFVADDPPPRAVEAVSAEFTRTGGDLTRVARALIALPEAWDERNVKLRAPQDWLIAALRALDASEAPSAVVRSLTGLRQPVWAPPAPKGFGDELREWSDPDSLLNRAELARTVARRFRAGAPDPIRMLELVEVAPSDPLRALLADGSIGREERIALALASPAFQWR